MATLYDQRLSSDASLDGYELEDLLLTHHERQRSRLAAMLPCGRAVAIVLTRGQHLRPGDVLLSSTNQALRIKAQPESLMKITAGTALSLSRLIYHLANRHVPAMLDDGAVYIEPDAVLGQMVSSLGGSIQMVQAAFEPEAGAYAGGHHHDHHPTHGDLSDHDMGRVGEMLSIAAHQETPGE
jgi:urease accessory protein